MTEKCSFCKEGDIAYFIVSDVGSYRDNWNYECSLCKECFYFAVGHLNVKHDKREGVREREGD